MGGAFACFWKRREKKVGTGGHRSSSSVFASVADKTPNGEEEDRVGSDAKCLP